MAQRTYISLSPSTMARLDSIADKYGVTRSALISMVLGQYCEATDQVFAAIPKAMQNVCNSNSPETPAPGKALEGR